MPETHDPLDPAHLIGHVKDSTYFEVPRFLVDEEKRGKIPIPQIRNTDEPIIGGVGTLIEPFELKITKFMILEVVAAFLVAVFFIWVANRIRSGSPPKGRLWNLLEAMLLFIRDQVARPAIGRHDADRFLPFLWTLFFFVLACNLLGMVPWAGSPTGALGVTGVLALFTFGTVIGAGMKKLGAVEFWKAQVPHVELPFIMAIFMKPMIFVIEVLGLCIKHFVLSVRLLANMFAGHLVLAVLIAFIAAAAQQSTLLMIGVFPASIFGAVLMSMLELFVAFLQAYIFVFLSSLFIGMAVHPH